jgi:hypothetical protein
MNLVFLNSLEKMTEEDRVKTAQVSICEDKGNWHVFWNESQEDGRPVQESWFEGQPWEAMLEEFRRNIRQKLEDGYSPLIREPFQRYTAERANFALLLQYYGDTRANEAVYEELRLWRRERAIKESKSAYIVATNSQLRMISSFLPQTIDELKQIPGMGKQRSDLYASDLLAITAKHVRQTSFPLDWVKLDVDESEYLQWLDKLEEDKENARQLRKQTKMKLLEGIANGVELAKLQQQLSLRRRDLLAMVEELDREGYDVQPLIDTELKSMPSEEREKAWSAFEEQGDRYLKPVMQLVYPEPTSLESSKVNMVYEWLRLLRLQFRREKGLA